MASAGNEEQQATRLGGHQPRYDAAGRLAPWTSWHAALDLEMNFYRGCPWDQGYPRFARVTFLDAGWRPDPGRTDTIPATQNGMGILSYLDYRTHLDQRGVRAAGDEALLDTARALGDYLVKETLTPDLGCYPAFTRSTGTRECLPLPADCGSQSDRPFEIEPDKGGIAGHALLRLYEATGEARYLRQALHNARVLAARQRDGDAHSSPWPFRVDYRSGEGRGPVSGNMTYILRLYDGLLTHGYEEFGPPRQRLWTWIRGWQIPSAAGDGALFAQFFEDHDTPTNRTAWSPLNLARYLLEKRAGLDPAWREQAGVLVDFTRRHFTHVEHGVRVCHEQDEDPNAWGGINSTYGAVLAAYAAADGSPDLAAEARAALNFTLYCIDEGGRPRDLLKNPAAGGWQEDAHTDVIHNYVAALRVFPEWGRESP